MSRGDTLATTLSELQRKIARFHSEVVSKNATSEEALDEGEGLRVPTMHWRIEHHFKDLEGKKLDLGGPADVPVQTACQSIDFRLDSEGAGIASSARIAAKVATRLRDFTFNRPFLIYLKKRESERPFFVMWVDNAELLRLR